MPPRAQVNWAWEKKENSSRRESDDSDRSRCSQAAMHGCDSAGRWGAGMFRARREYAGGVEGAPGPVASGSRDRTGGEYQRVLCDERARGGGLAGSRPLGAHGGHRQFKEAEIRPAGRPAAGAQALGGGSGPGAGGAVSAGGGSAATAAGASAVLAGGLANPGQESVAELAADARATSNGHRRVRRGGRGPARRAGVVGREEREMGCVGVG